MNTYLTQLVILFYDIYMSILKLIVVEIDPFNQELCDEMIKLDGVDFSRVRFDCISSTQTVYISLVNPTSDPIIEPFAQFTIVNRDERYYSANIIVYENPYSFQVYGCTTNELVTKIATIFLNRPEYCVAC